MSKSGLRFGGIVSVLACLATAASGLAQTPSGPEVQTSSEASSQSASSSTPPPTVAPKVITVIGSPTTRNNSGIRAVGMPDMLQNGYFELKRESASSCAFMRPYGSGPLFGNERAPFGSASLGGPRSRESLGPCAQADMNFAAGRSSIARRDHSLKDAFAAFDASDYPTAFKLFKASFRKMGYPTAALMVGRMYLYGIGTAQDVPEALTWFKKAAAYPLPRDIRTRAIMVTFNSDNPEPRDAVTDALMTMGNLHLYGLYVSQDFNEARKWYAKANGYGFAPAGDILGQIYQKGYGVAVDPKAAFGYFKKAAELGYGPAQYHLALIYYLGGEVTPQNPKLAMTWFIQAGKTGYPDAIYAMGRFYDLGEGVTADPQKALVYYKEAALKGQADAQNALGIYFYNGQLVPQDIVVARKWFEHAAMQGQVDAMFNLAAMYYRGEGGERDMAMAYVWFTLAKASGHPQAEAALQVIEPQLTPEDRARAEAILKPSPAKP